MSQQTAIELCSVTKVYSGGILALDDAGFQVVEGERCCLLGPNGAGKTTIMRLLEGALSPTSGRMSLLGVPVPGPRLLEAKRRIGIVPQNPGLYPDLTVREYLEFVRSLYGRGRIEAVAGAYGLADFIDRPLASLSGGYQRRLLLAAAVLSEPTLLLLDEPTVGLDPIAAAETRGLLRAAIRGRTVLMSTHNLAEAEELCDTVIILRGGRVLIHERIEDLRRQTMPRVYLAAQQGRGALEAALVPMGLTISPNGHGVWLTIEEPNRTMPDVLRSLLTQGVDVYECRIVPATLEDLFVEAVTRQ